MDATAIDPRSSAFNARMRAPSCTRSSATTTNSEEATSSVSAPRRISARVSGCSTTAKVRRLPHMMIAAAADVAAPSHARTPMLIQPGENDCDTRICRRTRPM